MRPASGQRQAGGDERLAESAFTVDLLNPGQVFACLGVLEAAEILQGDASAAFDWTGREVVFRVAAGDDEPPAERIMRFLEEADVVARVPRGSRNLEAWKKSWGPAPEVDEEGEPFPFPDPTSPATLPVVLRDESGNEIELDYWGDATKRDGVKFWAGAGGFPGAAITRDALGIARGKMRQHATNPFAFSGPQTISFRFDWRRDYIPLQDGFSPNRHGNVRMVGFPLVEVLAAIGLGNARPERRDRLRYRYGVLGQSDGRLLDPLFHRAALGAGGSPVPGNPYRRFAMHLDWPGQEGQARCIAHVSEEEETND